MSRIRSKIGLSIQARLTLAILLLIAPQVTSCVPQGPAASEIHSHEGPAGSPSKGRTLWRALLGCLAPETEQDVEESLAQIEKEPVWDWPLSASRPSAVLATDQMLARLTKDEHTSLTMYSITGFDQLRLYENSTKSELLKEGWADHKIQAMERWSTAIDGAIRKLPVVDATVYRGIHAVHGPMVASLLKSWKKRTPIGLGPKNKPAVTSTSWDPAVAKAFMQKRDSDFQILFEIKGGHHGVAIEGVAMYPGQREVLLPKREKFLIEKMNFIRNEPRALHVSLRAVH